MVNMLFQSFYRIDSWSFSPPIDTLKPININIGEAIINIRMEKNHNQGTSDVLLVTTIEKTINYEIAKYFEEKFEGNHDEKIDLEAMFSPPDNEFVLFTKKLEKELNEISIKILSLICWRNEIFSGPSSLDCSEVHMRWDYNKDNPSRVYELFLKNQYPSKGLILNCPTMANEKLSLNDILSNKAPLYYELLCDGVRVFDSSPRSSLVIIIAAIETAIKHYASMITPDSAWLIENIASPPLDKLLTSYLEKLPSKNKKLAYCLRIPKEEIKIIKHALEIRNKVVHGKNNEIDKEMLEKLKITASSTLYYFDWLKGEDWAYPYLSESLKDKIQKSLSNKSL